MSTASFQIAEQNDLAVATEIYICVYVCVYICVCTDTVMEERRKETIQM